MLYLGMDMDGEELMDCEIKKALVEFDSQSGYSSEESVPEPCVQEEHVQEVVSLDILEEQGCIEDHLAEEQEVVPFLLTDN